MKCTEGSYAHINVKGDALLGLPPALSVHPPQKGNV